MKITGVQTMIVTEKRAETKDFYVRHLGFEVTFDFGWYVQIRSSANPAVELSLLQPDRADQPEAFRPTFAGRGVVLNLYIEDADAEYFRLKSQGVEIDGAPRNEPWGERHFVVRDPSGVAVNLAAMNAPVAPEYAQENAAS
jgi:catechol 2,3-dioxygenase-like lactoylglutathione lyase family enzyme